MGSYVFRWPYPADDVRITGTFDDWGNTVQMDRVGDHWEKEVDLPSADETVEYKFVVNHEWTQDANAPTVKSGVWTNNVLTPDKITRKATATQVADKVPGAFPDTSASEAGSSSADAVPASNGDGSKSAVTSAQTGATSTSSKSPYQTAHSTATYLDDPSEKPAGSGGSTEPVFSVQPIASTSGAGVTTSKEDYEKVGGSEPAPASDTREPIFSAQPLPSTTSEGVTTSKEEYEKAGSAQFPGAAVNEEPKFSVDPLPSTTASGVTMSKEDYEKAGSSVLPEPTFSAQPVPSTTGEGVTTSKEDFEKGGSAQFPGASANQEPMLSAQPLPSTTGEGITTSKEDFEKAGSADFPGAATNKEQTFSVNPIPASSGVGNPISLPAGAPVPEQKDITPHTVDSTVTTSQEDYERSGSGAFPAAAAVGLAGVGAVGGGALASKLSKPDKKENLIPESSLPMGDSTAGGFDASPFISSAAAGTTTADLASRVPLENNPAISSSGPGTTTSDLAAKVPLESIPTISSSGPGTTTSDLASKVPLEKADPTISSSGPETTTAGLASKVPLDTNPAISSSGPDTTTAGLASSVPLEKKRQAMIIDPVDAPATVPDVVQESMSAAQEQPEAAASAEAVQDKTALEKELLSKTHRSEAVGQPASAAAQQTSYYGLATSVPAPVEKSMQEAHAPPEAAADMSVVAEKADVEKELLSKIPSTDEVGQPAPTIAAATSSTAPEATSADATATTLTDGKTANEAVPDTDTSTATHGPAAGAIAGGAVVGGAAAAGAAAAAARHKDTDVEPPRVSDSQKPNITTEATPATARIDNVPGQHPAAAAAVSDGAGETPMTEIPRFAVPVEKTDGATTEYAPVRTDGSPPGVSSAAAAALADGTEDPTALADEPAVKLMNKHEDVTGASAPTAGVTDKTVTAIDSTPAAGAMHVHEDVTNPVTSAPVAADKKVTATGASTSAAGPGSTGVQHATDTAAGVPSLTSAGTDKTKTVDKRKSAPPAPTTPQKKNTTGQAPDSPAASTGTGATNDTEGKRKKRHRLSAFFKKIFD